MHWLAVLILLSWHMSDTVKITATNEAAKYRVRIGNDTHTIIADEPIAQNGGDTGLNPHELLISSLAACTAITLRMYAERKGWDTGEITVEISMQTEKGDTQILRRLSFEKQLGDAERERLTMVANACPVHKVLTGKIAIDTQLA